MAEETKKEADIEYNVIGKRINLVNELFGEKNIEEFETARGQKIKLPYPKPITHYRLIWESPTLALEDAYFWFINNYSPGAFKIEKLRDIFTASPNSSFFGSSQQRLGLTQDKVSTYLQYIAKMGGDALRMLKELRAVCERLNYYESAGKDDKGLPNSAEITLRDIWISLVEGGTKNPMSVYGMAQTVGFAILPNLFFNVWVDYKSKEDEKNIDEVVAKLEIGNTSVKDALRRKLMQYYTWREFSFKELTRKRSYYLLFLKQHMSIVRMYLSWLRPYFEYIKRLTMRYQDLERPEVIASFETSLAELELLVIQQKYSTDMNACVLVTLKYISKPEMAYFTSEYQQKGPRHTGHVEVNLRSYAWTNAEIEKYKELLRKEDGQLLALVNQELQTALDDIDTYLKDYLGETQEQLIPKTEEEKKKAEAEKEKLEKEAEKKKTDTKNKSEKDKKAEGSIIETIAEIISDPSNIFGNVRATAQQNAIESDLKKAKEEADGQAWSGFNYFKKAKRLIAW